MNEMERGIVDLLAMYEVARVQNEQLRAETKMLRRLVVIGGTVCEQCGEPATTLDGSGIASCAECADAMPDDEDD
mgnify:CR=1 FL=1